MVSPCGACVTSGYGRTYRMIGRIVQKIGSLLYKHPVVAENRAGRGQFGQLKVALVADYFTTTCLAAECRIRSLTPDNYRDVITNWRPDLLFVESAFHGVGGEWRYKLAKQPKYIRFTKPQTIGHLVQLAQDRGVPAVFWNKDDGAFFENFLDVAKLFAHVFTTDVNCVSRYRDALPAGTTVQVLSMPFQPAFHFFDGFHFEHRRGCFVGSYYRRILGQRREFLDMLFGACDATGLGVSVFDRNSHRFSRYFEFSFPQHACLSLHSSVPYEHTGHIYKSHALSFNVNSVMDSETMCSRRLLEILACGGIAATNATPSVQKYFADYCHVLHSREEALELFARLRHGPDSKDKDRAAAGAQYVHTAHTWERRLEQLAETVKI